MKKTVKVGIAMLILIITMITTIIIFSISDNKLQKTCTGRVEANLVEIEKEEYTSESYGDGSSGRYIKEYTARYEYVVNNKTYTCTRTFSEYPRNQIIVKYNPNNPSEICVNSGGPPIIMLSALFVFGGVIFYFFVLDKISLDESPSDKNTTNNKFGGE